MVKGVVKRLTDKGFGFISLEGETNDVFFHATALDGELDFDDLKEGDELEFEVVKGDKGKRAESVRRAAG